MKKEGWLSILGVFGESVAVDLGMALRKGLNIRVTYSCTYGHYEKALQLLSTGQIDLTPLSTAYDYTDVQRAYEEALNKICLKPVLRFS